MLAMTLSSWKGAVILSVLTIIDPLRPVFLTTFDPPEGRFFHDG
jgi:hypothetical protein